MNPSHFWLARLPQKVVAAGIVACLIALPAVAEPLIRAVALSGQPAPGTSTGVHYSSFSSPVLNSAGQTAFLASLSGSGVNVSNIRGIWSERSAKLELVARTGSQAPGTPSGVNYFFLNIPVMNAAGQTAFQAFLIGSGVDGTNNEGIWSEGSGTLNLVAREGSQAPGIPDGVNFSAFGDPRAFHPPPWLNDIGQTAFYALLTGSGVDGTNNVGIWTEGSGHLVLVARSGNHAAGTPTGVNYAGFGSPVLNAAGQTAFNGFLTGNDVDMTNNEGIWAESSGNLALVARSGSQAPGTPSVHYSRFGSPVLNATGQTAFWAQLTGSGVDNTNDEGIWSADFDDVELLARKGNQAPGTLSGAIYNGFRSHVLNAVGQTAFRATLAGNGVDATNNEGIWAGDSGDLELVARKGSQAAGTDSGINYASFNSPVLNAAGQTAFFAILAGSGVNITNNEGIWATDLNGTLQLIARKGDLLEVATSDFRRMSSVSFFDGLGDERGRRSGFNDRGQLAFRATFTDGSSGVFVSNLVANPVIPEPSSLSLLALNVIGVSAMRRRSRA